MIMLALRSFLIAQIFCAAVLAQAGSNTAFVRVSPRDQRYLELTDKTPYIPIGLNMIAPPYVKGSENDSLRAMEAWLSSLSSNGGNYIRVWLSSPFWDVESEKSGVYDATKARRIESLLELCLKYNIRVKFTTEHFRSIGNGTQKWADKPLYHVANGGPAKSIADFFDGEASRAQFIRKIQWYKERFGDQPSGYGWELWNEINAVRGGDYMAWTAFMLPELHKAFPKNMAMQSLGSFDTDRVRDVYKRHSTMPGNDLAQVHRYLDLGAKLEICKGPVDVMAADAVRELLSYAPGRPVILAESGAVEPQHSGPFKLYGVDREGMLLHDILFAPFFAGAAGPGQIWHWDSYVAANDLWRHYARFSQTVKNLDPPAEGFEPVMLPNERLRIYALKGRHTLLIWCRDTRNTWESELKNGGKPELMKGMTVDLSTVLNGKTPKSVRVYDPWSDQWSDAKLKKGKLSLPQFSRSIVVRVDR
jgi:hypothetical protein